MVSPLSESLLTNTYFAFFILEWTIVKRIDVTSRESASKRLRKAIKL